MVLIRPVLEGELNRAVPLLHTAFAEKAERFGLTAQNCPTHTAFLTLERLIFEQSNGVLMYFLMHRSALAGFFGLDLREHELILTHLGVLPEHRRHGCGTAALGFARDKAHDFGLPIVSVGLIDADLPLKSWYARNGFSERETRDLPILPFAVCYMEALTEV